MNTHTLALSRNHLLIASICLLWPTIPRAQETFQKYEMHIKNGMSPNNVPLIIHCKSMDDDLGVHSLAVGDEFHFSFKINFMGTTLFFCSINWGQKNTRIDVFRTKEEGAECAGSGDTGECYCNVLENAYYFCCDNKTWSKRYDWP